jgi:hypothetical protein
MMTNSALSTALDLATSQLDAAINGDYDRLLASLEDYERACADAARGLTADDEPVLRRLIATNARIATLVAHGAHEAREHLVRLQERKGLATAYYAGSASIPLTADRSA